MEIAKAIKFLTDRINELEKQVYVFDTIARPRYEQDLKILADMKRQVVQLDALKQKADSGQDVTADEVYAAVPQVFR